MHPTLKYSQSHFHTDHRDYYNDILSNFPRLSGVNSAFVSLAFTTHFLFHLTACFASQVYRLSLRCPACYLLFFFFHPFFFFFFFLSRVRLVFQIFFFYHFLHIASRFMSFFFINPPKIPLPASSPPFFSPFMVLFRIFYFHFWFSFFEFCCAKNIFCPRFLFVVF